MNWTHPGFPEAVVALSTIGVIATLDIINHTVNKTKYLSQIGKLKAFTVGVGVLTSAAYITQLALEKFSCSFIATKLNLALALVTVNPNLSFVTTLTLVILGLGAKMTYLEYQWQSEQNLTKRMIDPLFRLRAD